MLTAVYCESLWQRVAFFIIPITPSKRARLMIHWPCLFKLEGDDELLFIPSENALIEELESLIGSNEDILIDSIGEAFQVGMGPDRVLLLTRYGRTLTLAEVTSLIQAHEFALAQVCLTKIHFNSVSEAVQALRSQD